jgi:hypothetical protein
VVEAEVVLADAEGKESQILVHEKEFVQAGWCKAHCDSIADICFPKKIQSHFSAFFAHRQQPDLRGQLEMGQDNEKDRVHNL